MLDVPRQNPIIDFGCSFRAGEQTAMADCESFSHVVRICLVNLREKGPFPREREKEC